MKKAGIIILLATLFAIEGIAQGYRTNRTNENTKVKLNKSSLGKNIIAFAPMQVFTSSSFYNSGTHVCVGVSYERIFNNEFLSVKLPVSMAINTNRLFITPTLKLYPKKQGVAKYAVGPQLFIGLGEEEFEQYIPTPTGGYTQYIREQRNQFGFGINNSINFTVVQHFYLGLEATLGILYYDSFNQNVASPGYSNNSGISQTFNLGFCMGYRF